ncbi:MAG: IS1595 family transposase [Acidimicrobiales bacterium]
MESVSIPALASKIQSEADAYLYMEKLRWNGTPVCPQCGSEHVSYIRPLDGVSRRTRSGSISQRRVWKCQACPGRKQFSVLTGTIFHGTKIPVRTWLFVIFEMCASKNGVSAREIERKYDLTAKTAWFMLHRIREAMVREPLAGMLGGNGGTVVADETFVGGKLNRMNNKRRAAAEAPAELVPGGQKLGGPAWNKTSVLSLVDTTTGEVRSQVVRDVTGATLRKAIADQVDMANTVLHTDEAKAYNAVGAEFLAHESVNHKQGEYTRRSTRGTVTSNQAESFFSQLKRSIDGTHHKVSSVHLHRYLAEFDFRHSTRRLSDSKRMDMFMGQTGDRRLSYRPLTGRG